VEKQGAEGRETKKKRTNECYIKWKERYVNR
jgi:hypothetical protein